LKWCFPARQSSIFDFSSTTMQDIAWRSLANDRSLSLSLSMSLNLSLSLKLGEAWRAVLCCALLASGVSQLDKAKNQKY
jgi:hypothetical protein